MPNHLDAVVLVLVLLGELLNFLFMELHCVVDEQVDAVLLIDKRYPSPKIFILPFQNMFGTTICRKIIRKKSW